ncbi:penicillin-binding protein 2 [Vibrio vulnificus]|uniref:penicillin-binding protein 2 n=1 Tax=Vibrio vulnificus TaxID=672 RepID=UPI0005F15B9C|nr:penicillin-binding protein 2 [Vibrio vulnificus]EIO3939658.1 penicillin-binding protein 2 [Vibrio vulnificus]EKZ9053678.1 penicillin-binding protein 2 [Vibrio vulnificus]MBN8082505.1 penicillin-binding protein 2 [Vibrio vulnificus]MBN8104768.1 penicillin-binding protein 2 [Vibrio vulnificus]MBN8125558.1 penicillin-binding protein 2 [Vibrio vulnificus]
MNHFDHKFRSHKDESKMFARRAIIAFLFILALCGVLIANLYYLEVNHFADYQTRSNDNRIKILPIAPVRGLIYDRHGQVLADNILVYDLELIPEEAENIPDTIKMLKRYISLSDEQEAQFYQRLKQTRHFRAITIAEDLSEQEVARFSVHQYQFPGVQISTDFRRYYPYKASLTHTIGYVAHINDHDLTMLKEQEKQNNYKASRFIGKLGIEKHYEELLHGQEGYQEVEINSHGRIIRTLKYVPPVAGKDLILNIDADLQNYVFTQMDNQAGSAIVLSPQDNSVLAMVSSPSYDPNLFVSGISVRDYRALLNNPAHPLLNRATLGVYPPASTVKPFMAIAALQEQVITPNTTRNNHGVWRIPGSKRTSHSWRDWKRWGHGDVNVTKAIEESVDSFFYQVAFDLGIDRISSWMNAFGFGRRTGIDIDEETSANMPTRAWKQQTKREPWYQGDTVPIGIGQGYWTATPLQIAQSTSILVNHGQRTQPHLLYAIKNHGEEMSALQPVHYDTETRMAEVPDAIWNISLNGMRLVNHGTKGSGRKAFKGADYISGGKSGTAQVFGLAKGETYNSQKLTRTLLDHGLFTAFAPYQHPEFVATVVLEHGNGGARVGAPLVRKIFDYAIHEKHPQKG